jgi:hypothetical protein
VLYNGTKAPIGGIAMNFFDFGNERDPKRSLGERDKKILFRNAKGRCQNPACNKKIGYEVMEVGHKTAWSRGGSTTFKNSVCLCHQCNHEQGDDSWAVFMKKQGIEDPKAKMKQLLENLNLQQLKFLVAKHKVKLSGYVEESLFSSRRVAPTKRQYINKLSGIVTNVDLRSVPKEVPKPAKKKRRRKADDSWF